MDSNTIINRAADSCGIELSRASALTEALAAAMRACCASSGTVAIPGFGNFAPVKTDECITDTADGRRMLMPPHISVEFRASSMLRKHLRAHE